MKKIKIFIYVLLIAFSFNSCDLNNESEIDGHDLTGSAIIVGWGSSTATESYFEDFGTIEKNYPIDVLGGSDGSPTSNDISIGISINTAETTATEGAAGEFTLNSTSVVIPAGEGFGRVSIGINTNNFSVTEPTKVVLDIATSVDGVVVSSLSKTMTLNFVGCQSDIADYTYNVTIVRAETGSVTEIFNEVITSPSVNNFITGSVGHWPLGPSGVEFEDICGTLYIASHSLAATYSNPVTALGTNNFAGEVNENGDFVLRYNIGPSGDTIWGNYTATYIKQ